MNSVGYHLNLATPTIVRTNNKLDSDQSYLCRWGKIKHIDHHADTPVHIPYPKKMKKKHARRSSHSMPPCLGNKLGLLPSPNEYDHPSSKPEHHEGRSCPAHSQKCMTPGGCNSNVVAVLVDSVHGRCDGSLAYCRRNCQEQESQLRNTFNPRHIRGCPTHQGAYGVNGKAKVPSHEKSENGTDQGQSSRDDAEAVEYEQRMAGNFGGSGSSLDLLGPTDISQIDARHQLTLQDTTGIEVKQGRGVGAVSDILMARIRPIP
jgi:hypothetical protein